MTDLNADGLASAARPTPARSPIDPLIVHIVRHGQSYNTHRSEGEPYPANPPLTPTGVAEAKQVASRLAALGIDRIVTSPMLRSVETASYIGEATGLPVEVWSRCFEFREAPGYLCFGARQLRQRFPDLVLPDDLDVEDWQHGEEKLDAALERADAFRAWLSQQGKRAIWRQIAVVTHGAFTRLLLAKLFEADPTLIHRMVLDNTSLTSFRIYPDWIQVLGINDVSHLVAAPEIDPQRGITR
jgi:ribonuclease H / adenosylcobalamin/alpha-ribazole phosphatase